MYWINESNINRGSSNQTSFYCDVDEDIYKLPTSTTQGVQQGIDTISCKPCGIGSDCFCIGSSSVFILNSSNEWIKI